MTSKMYLTKYALSRGVKGIEADPSGQYVRDINNRWGGLYTIGRDVFESKQDAMADAEKRRKSKIASLKKQIAKLEKLTFVVVE